MHAILVTLVIRIVLFLDMDILTTILNVSELKLVPHGCAVAYGHFDTIHTGHIRYLRHAKTLGTSLIVALQGDSSFPGQNLQFSAQERSEALSLLGIADYIIVLNNIDLLSVLRLLSPSVLVLGDESRLNDFPEELSEYALSNSIDISFHSGDSSSASVDLLSANPLDLDSQRKHQFIQACKRQNIQLPQLLNYVGDLSKARIAVIGDTIVDQFAACEALGMSAEAPVIVVKELENKNFIGAAAIVASHVRSFGASCDLISVVGNDHIATFVSDYLADVGIGNFLVSDSSRPTTFKKRYLVENQKLFRVSRLEDHSIDRKIEDLVKASLDQVAPVIDALIISDFVYGVITPNILNHIYSLHSKFGFQIFGDVQCSSQVDSILKFKNFTLLSPNEREVRIALQDKDSGIEQLSYEVMAKTNVNNFVMKLGSSGFISYERSIDNVVKSQPFPALSTNPVDVSGAGDSVLAVISTALASGIPFMHASALACCTASLAVETMGNLPVTPESLKSRLTSIFNN